MSHVRTACVIPWYSALHSQVSPRGRGSVRNRGCGFITVDLLLAVVGVCVCVSAVEGTSWRMRWGGVHVQWTRKAWGPCNGLRKKFYWHVWSDWLKRRGSAVAWGFDSVSRTSRRTVFRWSGVRAQRWRDCHKLCATSTATTLEIQVILNWGMGWRICKTFFRPVGWASVAKLRCFAFLYI